MKKLILALALTLSFGASANDKGNLCEGMSELAGKIMYGRQNNMLIQDAFMLINKSKFNEKEKQAWREIILVAYEMPAFSSESMKLRQIVKFRNEVFTLCIKGQ